MLPDYNRQPMHDVPPTTQLPALRSPDQPTLPTTQPELAELFAFMAQAELRFDTLRMRIVDRRITTHGDETETIDVTVRHPGLAKVISSRSEGPGADFDVWVSDGETVRTFSAANSLATSRRLPRRPVGADSVDLPSFARIYQPVTTLPPETLADTFVHPNGFCRNVLGTGVVTRRGTASIAGREAILLRCDHPRTSHVLTDRPDHWLEVGIDVQTGVLLLLAEHVGAQTTRHSEVTTFALDEVVVDDVFKIHVSSDTRTLY